MMNLKEALTIIAKIPFLLSSSSTMIPSISPRWPPLGLKIRVLKSSHGQHNLQTSIQLKISGTHLKRKLTDYEVPLKWNSRTLGYSREGMG